MDSEQKRLYLRVTAKLMVTAMLLVLAYVFLLSVFSGPPQGQQTDSLRYELDKLKPGQLVRLVWDKKRILVMRREKLDAAQRKQLVNVLQDPQSQYSQQPGFAMNPYRSRDPRYFVALDYGTDLNCQLDYVDAKHPGPQGMLWLGGLRDRCRGSWYDDAGRVYKGQSALRNIAIPDYRIEGHTLIIGG